MRWPRETKEPGRPSLGQEAPGFAQGSGVLHLMGVVVDAQPAVAGRSHSWTVEEGIVSDDIGHLRKKGRLEDVGGDSSAQEPGGMRIG